MEDQGRSTDCEESVDYSIAKYAQESKEMCILLIAVQRLEDALFREWRCSLTSIGVTNSLYKNRVLRDIDKNIERLDLHSVEKQSLLNLSHEQYKQVHTNVEELIDSLLQQLCEDCLWPSNFEETLNSILECQMQRMIYDLNQFCLNHITLAATLIGQIQQLFIRILTQFFNYQLQISNYANHKMSQLDLIMTSYPTIANKENYKYMQKEVSHTVINYAETLLRTQSFGYEQPHKIAKQSIKHFYYLMNECQTLYQPEMINPKEIIDEMERFQRARYDISDVQSSQILPNLEGKQILKLSHQQIQEQENVGLRLILLYHAKYKKLSGPKKPIRYGTQVNAVAGKAFGAGLGQLLVDSLDEDISWDDKLKNAGFTTLSLGTLGLLASRLPVVGILIQQVILAFAVKKILENKVISDEETSKNLFHLAMQITIGLGLTIAGSMIWPGFWGAFIGGFGGGVGMGLYSKVIVTKSMDNLILMMNKASKMITKTGQVRLTHYAVEKMKFDMCFFDKHNPGLPDDDWFTMLMYALSNEVRAVSKANYQSQVIKLVKKRSDKSEQTLIQLTQRQSQIEASLSLWEDCLVYLKQKEIPLLHNAKIISEFVEGLMMNFKIQ